MNQEFEPIKKGRAKVILAGLVVILLITNAMSLYLVFQKKGTLDRTEAELQTRIEKFKSLKRYFEAQQKELQLMGADNDSLNRQIEGINRDLTALKSFKNASFTLEQQQEYKKKSEELSESLTQREDALRRTREQNDSLYRENKGLMAERRRLSDSVTVLAFTKKILTEKVMIASAMKAENLRITAINARGKERSSDQFRASAVSKLRILFTLADNPVADHGNRRIFVRIIKPDGSLLGSAGTFKYKDNLLSYTTDVTAYFANNKPQTDVLYDAQADYGKGSYKTELYCEGFKIGESSFVIR